MSKTRYVIRWVCLVVFVLIPFIIGFFEKRIREDSLLPKVFLASKSPGVHVENQDGLIHGYNIKLEMGTQQRVIIPGIIEINPMGKDKNAKGIIRARVYQTVQDTLLNFSRIKKLQFNFPHPTDEGQSIWVIDQISESGITPRQFEIDNNQFNLYYLVIDSCPPTAVNKKLIYRKLTDIKTTDVHVHQAISLNGIDAEMKHNQITIRFLDFFGPLFKNSNPIDSNHPIFTGRGNKNIELEINPITSLAHIDFGYQLYSGWQSIESVHPKMEGASYYFSTNAEKFAGNEKGQLILFKLDSTAFYDSNQINPTLIDATSLPGNTKSGRPEGSCMCIIDAEPGLITTDATGYVKYVKWTGGFENLNFKNIHQEKSETLLKVDNAYFEGAVLCELDPIMDKPYSTLIVSDRSGNFWFKPWFIEERQNTYSFNFPYPPTDTLNGWYQNNLQTRFEHCQELAFIKNIGLFVANENYFRVLKMGIFTRHYQWLKYFLFQNITIYWGPRILYGLIFLGLIPWLLVQQIRFHLYKFKEEAEKERSRRITAENQTEQQRQLCSEIEHLKRQLEDEKDYLLEEIKMEQNFEEIIGNSQALKNTLQKVEEVASTDATVLILGETGTGKELIARAIHYNSPRKNRIFAASNCAGLPDDVLESELFGHVRGAYTGAIKDRKGLFESANGGTVFLDEVGDISNVMQLRLLRVLQEKEIQPLGSDKKIQIDVRIISATNRDLTEAIRQGHFRADLYYRLNVFPITLPPLRERKEDIPLLVNHLVKKYCRETKKQIDHIPQHVMHLLQESDWQGNVRELDNIIERAVIITHGKKLMLPTELYKTVSSPENYNFQSLEEMEKDHILKALERSGGRKTGKNGAAKMLGLKDQTLISKMRKLGLLEER
ncbi:MAG: sigma 54-interacting transcriptional regulator [Deferribacteres bacterium]|nr:sigma 54-interacting transcriptional regulator [Deferribacteres bacterium]